MELLTGCIPRNSGDVKFDLESSRSYESGLVQLTLARKQEVFTSLDITMQLNKISLQYFKTPIGELVLGTFHEKLCLCDWRYRKMRPTIDKRIRDGLDAAFEEGETIVMETAKHQLNEYFSAKRIDFNIPLLMVGTSFQKMVWNELLKIPFGKTESYLGLSRKIGNKKAVRSVAAANGANALAIFIPCHRIIGSDGRLTGYAGGLQAKRKLLQLEMHKQTSDQLKLFD